MMYTIEQKYKWLCSQLRVSDVSYWEGDALLKLKTDSLYFQFPLAQLDSGLTDEFLSDMWDVDKAVEHCMGEI